MSKTFNFLSRLNSERRLPDFELNQLRAVQAGQAEAWKVVSPEGDSVHEVILPPGVPVNADIELFVAQDSAPDTGIKGELTLVPFSIDEIAGKVQTCKARLARIAVSYS